MNIKELEKTVVYESPEDDQELFPDYPVEEFFVQGCYNDCSREMWCMNWGQVKEYVKHLEGIEGLKFIRILPFVALYEKRYNYWDGKRDSGCGCRLAIRKDMPTDPFILDEQACVEVNKQ